jgi:hypothetical protein
MFSSIFSHLRIYIGNTEALDMVKKEAGAEARCIGVVTKCDLVHIPPDIRLRFEDIFI